MGLNEHQTQTIEKVAKSLDSWISYDIPSKTCGPDTLVDAQADLLGLIGKVSPYAKELQ